MNENSYDITFSRLFEQESSTTCVLCDNENLIKRKVTRIIYNLDERYNKSKRNDGTLSVRLANSQYLLKHSIYTCSINVKLLAMMQLIGMNSTN